MTTFVKPDLDSPVNSVQDLIDYLARGARPRENWGIGAEMEKLVLDIRTGEAAPFSRIEALLESIERETKWRGFRENGRLLGLQGESSSITLEPGGQLELSGALCPDIHCSHGDFSRHISQIGRQAEPLGLCFLGLGVQPFTSLEEISWLPKSRYEIMGPYMLRTGDMGQRMMKQTAGLQVNLDFEDEADCIEKLRTGLALSPLFYALFANSPIMEGAPTGYLSTRGEIWSRTDPDRTGLLLPIFRKDAGFATYVEIALDVPMYFVVRDGRYLDFTQERITFRRYLAEGYGGCRATISDWDLHLSTLFTEARLRPQIELRCADSLPPHLTLGVAALAKGILYDTQAREAVWSIFENQTEEDRLETYRNSWRIGLKARMGNRTLREVSLEIIALAREGLARQEKLNANGLDETIYMDGISEIAESGVTLAERILRNWTGSRLEKWKMLLDHGDFRKGLD